MPSNWQKQIRRLQTFQAIEIGKYVATSVGKTSRPNQELFCATEKRRKSCGQPRNSSEFSMYARNSSSRTRTPTKGQRTGLSRLENKCYEGWRYAYNPPGASRQTMEIPLFGTQSMLFPFQTPKGSLPCSFLQRRLKKGSKRSLPTQTICTRGSLGSIMAVGRGHRAP